VKPPLREASASLLVALLLTPIAIWAGPVLWLWLRSQLPDKILARVFALLLVLLCWSWLYIWHLHRTSSRSSRKFDKRFELVMPSGVWRDKKTGILVCPACKVKQIESPLRQDTMRLVCNVCGWRVSKSETQSSGPILVKANVKRGKIWCGIGTVD